MGSQGAGSGLGGAVAEGGVVDGGEGEAVLAGEGQAVGVFGAPLGELAGVASDFDSDGAVRGGDLDDFAVEDGAAVFAPAHAEGGGVAEEEGGEAGFFAGAAQEMEDVAGAAFFHDARGAPDIEGSCVEEGLGGGGEELGGDVVEVGGEFDDGFDRAAEGRGGSRGGGVLAGRGVRGRWGGGGGRV